MLALAGIEKRFGALAALADIDLEVAAGEVLGIIGPNGSGKTTLLNTVTGVYPPSAGRISFQGTDITGWKRRDLRTRCSGVRRCGRSTWARTTGFDA